MDVHKILKYDARVPRYTSYPTAAQFHDGVDSALYARWLATIDPGRPVSLYCHVPFCHMLCWYCGCHTQVARSPEVTDAYADLLCREIDLVADRLPAGVRVSHLHWGGGTPTMLGARQICRIVDHMATRFGGLDAVELAVEIDPRVVSPEDVCVLGSLGLKRASVGVQDFDPDVQRAVNRRQTFEQTAAAVELLRAAGVEDLNLDLIYGLPRQRTESFLASVDAAHRLGPDRLALFGYAHVPWMKRHQRLIERSDLPSPSERLRLFTAAAGRLESLGYMRVGLDHFARPGSELARAAREGRLHRNFQGYTTDDAPVLLGFGASAIGTLPQGFVQNAASVRVWREKLAAGDLPVVRGVERTPEDRLRADIIERLMCDFRVDLPVVCARHGVDPAELRPEVARLAPLVRDGFAAVEDGTVRVTPAGRPLVRSVSAVFDSYLSPAAARHARAI